MQEIEDIKLILKSLLKTDMEQFKQVYNLCSSNSYIHLFPKICKESFNRKLNIEDYSEYILDKKNNIEDRYSLYWRMRCIPSLLLEEDKSHQLYKSIYEDTLGNFSNSIAMTENEDDRLLIFINQYNPNTRHSPSILLEKILKNLIDKFGKIIIVSSTPYSFPYPMDKFYSFHTNLQENELININEQVSCIELRGYITENIYLDFINSLNISTNTKLISIGHSNLYFDLINTKNKFIFPTSYHTVELTNAVNIITSSKKSFKNINNKVMKNIQGPTDYTSENYIYSVKNIKPTDTIKVAIIGNRLDDEMDLDLLNSLKILIKSMPTINIYIIGTFENINLIDREIINNFIFAGPKWNLVEYLIDKEINFYLNPKRHGGGQSAIMAVNLGMPVISLDFGDVSENIKRKYYINDFSQITDFVYKYVNDDEFKSEIDKKNMEIIDENKNDWENLSNLLEL